LSAEAISRANARIQGPVKRAKRLFVAQTFGVGLYNLEPKEFNPLHPKSGDELQITAGK
jgi:hypothetical protein